MMNEGLSHYMFFDYCVSKTSFNELPPLLRNQEISSSLGSEPYINENFSSDFRLRVLGDDPSD